MGKKHNVQYKIQRQKVKKKRRKKKREKKRLFIMNKQRAVSASKYRKVVIINSVPFNVGCVWIFYKYRPESRLAGSDKSWLLLM